MNPNDEHVEFDQEEMTDSQPIDAVQVPKNNKKSTKSINIQYNTGTIIVLALILVAGGYGIFTFISRSAAQKNAEELVNAFQDAVGSTDVLTGEKIDRTPNESDSPTNTEVEDISTGSRVSTDHYEFELGNPRWLNYPDNPSRVDLSVSGTFQNKEGYEYDLNYLCDAYFLVNDKYEYDALFFVTDSGYYENFTLTKPLKTYDVVLKGEIPEEARNSITNTKVVLKFYQPDEAGESSHMKNIVWGTYIMDLG